MFRGKGWASEDVLASEEVPRDPGLPELAKLLLADSAERLLAPWLSSNGLSCESVRIRHVRYRPGRDCSIVYELRGTERPGDAPALLNLKAFSVAPPKSRLARWKRRAERSSVAGPVFGWLEDERSVLTPFPVDLRLPSLPELVEPRSLRESLRDALNRPDAVFVDGDPVTIVSYKPGRSCLVRCRLRLDGPGSTARTLFARTRRDERGAAVLDAMTRLRESARLSERVAEPLAHDTARCLFIESGLSGAVLGERLQESSSLDDLADTARTLAAVHAIPSPADEGRSARRELDSLTRAGRSLLSALPAALVRFEQVLTNLAATCPKPAPMRFIHGDFSAGQVLVDDSGVRLIDFERIGPGDPHVDLGSFLARLPRNAEAAGLPDGWTRRATTVFLDSYERAAPDSIDPSRTDWHRRVATLRLALHAVRHLRPGWPHRLQQQLDRAANRLPGDG